MNARWFLLALTFVLVLSGILAISLNWPLDRDAEVQIGDRTLTSYRVKVIDRVSEDMQNVVVQPTSEFLVEYAFGDGLSGFDILCIQADGRGEYDYWDQSSESTRQKKLTFELSAKDLEEICGKLNQSGFMALANEYRGSVPDGTQIAITVVTGHGEKEVYCDNHFPGAVVAVADYLEKEIIQPNRNDS